MCSQSLAGRCDFMAFADCVFINNCKHILQKGIWQKESNLFWPNGDNVNTLNCFGIINRYDLSKEFPILTIKKTNLSMAIDEILWIWQKKSNNVFDLKGKFWNNMADSSGSIGKAYGYQLGIKDKYLEGEFDQVDRLLYELKNNPSSRRMIANMYNHKDLYESNIYPCAYSLTLSVENGKLNGILNQRSQEMLCANNWNVCEYAVLIMMFAYSCDLEPGELLHVISTAIIYDKHVSILNSIINLKPYPAPQMIVEKKNDFYQYKNTDFKLKNYLFHDYEGKIIIPERRNE